MALFSLKKLLVASGLGMAILVGASVEANGQTRREIERERQRIERENARYQRERQRRNRMNRNESVDIRRAERYINNANYANGYQQGLQAGEYDRRRGKYNQSNVYRDTGSLPSDGDPTSGDYMYRQGFLQGYNDGFHGIRNY